MNTQLAKIDENERVLSTPLPKEVFFVSVALAAGPDNGSLFFLPFFT